MLVACSGDGEPGASRLQPPPVVGAIDVLPESPWVQGRVTASTGCTGLPPLQYEWRFGGAAPVRGSQPSAAHVFATAGVQAVSVRCIDANGRSAEAVRQISVDGRNLNSVAGRPCSGAVAGHGWCRQWPAVAGVVLAAATALDPNRWWGVDSAGQVQRTNDGGKTWQGQFAAGQVPGGGFAAVSAQKAWVISGGEAIWHSADGGASWRIQWRANQRNLERIWAVNERVVWALGLGQVLRTADGGASWQTVWQAAESDRLQLAVVDAERAWVFAPGQTLFTLDGGRVWQDGERPQPAQEALTAFAADAARSQVWLLGARGSVWRLEASGRRWELLSAADGGPVDTYTGLASFDGRRLWRVGFRFDRLDAPTSGSVAPQALLRVSVDGGRNWSAAALPLADDALLDVAAVDAGSALLLGARSLLFDTPGGTTILSERPRLPRLSAMSALDATHAFAVGLDGSALTTVDGGARWQARPLPQPVALYDVLTRAPGQAWAVGRSTQLWRTTDGGLNWQPQALPTDRFVNAIVQADAERVWLFGDAGSLLRTVDGGATWSATVIDAGWHLHAAAAQDRERLWAIGSSTDCDPPCRSALFTSADGGATWAVVPQPPGVQLLKRVAAPGAGVVWLVGSADDGVQQAWLSRDDGRHWSGGLPLPLTLATAVAARDADTAWVGGWSGVAKTTDGGRTWTRQAERFATTLRLSDLQATDAQTLWAADLEGDLWKTLTGGD